MHLGKSGIGRGATLWIRHWAGLLACLTLVAGCPQSRCSQGTVSEELDLTRAGEQRAGGWTYVYSISNPGSRSEGYYGTLSYNQSEVSVPMHVNDFYETPLGRLYWVGEPVVLFGSRGWMSTPAAREPIGQALIDPAIAHSDRFLLKMKVVAPEELATPDRLEQNAAVLEALKPFDLAQIHVQSDWFAVRSDPITLHDTKRCGTFTVSRADLIMQAAPALEFECTSDLTVDRSPRPTSLAETMAAPEFLAGPTRVVLSPQIDTLQPVRCTLTPVVGDPLVLYVVCRIQDQGPTPPWTSPVVLQREAGQPAPTDSKHLQ
jgi:hypothetical protein